MKLIPLTGSIAYSINNSHLIVGSSLIYDENFDFCFNMNDFDVSTEQLQEEITNRLRRVPTSNNDLPEFEFTRLHKKTITIDGATIPFNLVYPNNYFHFLINSLPSLLYLMSTKFIENDHIIVTGILHPNMINALKLVTENKFQIMELQLHSTIKSTKSVAAKDSFSWNEKNNGCRVLNYQCSQSNLLALRKFFSNYCKPKDIFLGRKLFILRQSKKRALLNLKELSAAAKAQGFLIVDPGSLSFLHQIELFCSASMIVGPTGSWLANLLFVQKGVNVKILYPRTCKTPISIWKKLGDILGVNVADYYFDDVVFNESQPMHSDFTVDPRVFNEIIKS